MKDHCSGINTFAKSEYGHVYACDQCGMIHVIYKSIVLALDEFEFSCFLACTSNITEEHFDFPHPQGLAATISFQKLQDGFFCIIQRDLIPKGY